MKQNMKRILSVALVLCLAVNVFCNETETAQAAAYKKTIKKTFKLKGGEAKKLKFKTKANASLTLTAKVKGDCNVTLFYNGAGTVVKSLYLLNSKKLTSKIKSKKGTQNLTITSVGQEDVTVTVEIKTKKSALKFTSLKKTKVMKSSSSDEEK